MAAVVISRLGRDIGNRVRALRQERGMGQGALAELVGTTQSTISAMENRGTSNFNLATLEALAWAFDVDLVVEFRPRAG